MLFRSKLNAHFRLGFPSAPCFLALNLACSHNSSDRSTKSTPSSFNALRLLVNTGFQVLFHSPPGVLFTFPSRYFFTIGHRLVFRLGGWSPLLPTRFLVSRGTLESTSCLPLRIRGFYSLWRKLSSSSSARVRLTYRSPQPRTTEVFRFGLFRFRSPLLKESSFLSFPVGT